MENFRVRYPAERKSAPFFPESIAVKQKNILSGGQGRFRQITMDRIFADSKPASRAVV
jgi:hypothetical protein